MGEAWKRSGEAGEELTRMTLLEHLEELRRRLAWSIAAILVGFLLCWYWAPPIFAWLSVPIRAPHRGAFRRLHNGLFLGRGLFWLQGRVPDGGPFPAPGRAGLPPGGHDQRVFLDGKQGDPRPRPGLRAPGADPAPLPPRDCHTPLSAEVLPLRGARALPP